MAEQVLRVGHLHDKALVDHGDAVTDEAHHAQIVADEQVGQPTLTLELAHQVQHLGADGHVQGGNGFVSNDEFRVHHQGAGDADALALAAGELVGEAGGKLGQQTHVVQRLGDLLGDLLLGVAAPLQAFGDDVVDLGALVQGGHGILEDHLDLVGDLAIQLLGDAAGDLLAVELDGAAAGGVHADDAAANGGFAGAGFAHDAEGLALVDIEADALHGLEALAAGTEGHLQVANLEDHFAVFISHGSHLQCP